jgi:hypothetical protein
MLRNRAGATSKAVLVIIGGLVVIVWIAITFVAHEVPDDALTRNRMRVTQRRILAYYSSQGKPPSSLADLPAGEKNVDNNTKDAWGRAIDYEEVDGSVVLESLGRDGKPGGAGQDQDIILVFNPADSEMLESFSSALPSKKAESEASD